MEMLRELAEVARAALMAVGKYRTAPQNDPASAAALAIQFATKAEADEFATRNQRQSIIESAGRHIYTNWPPLVGKLAYRDDVTPFLSPEGKDCDFGSNAAPQTLDILSRTFYVTPYWQTPLHEVETSMSNL